MNWKHIAAASVMWRECAILAAFACVLIFIATAMMLMSFLFLLFRPRASTPSCFYRYYLFVLFWMEFYLTLLFTAHCHIGRVQCTWNRMNLICCMLLWCRGAEMPKENHQNCRHTAQREWKTSMANYNPIPIHSSACLCIVRTYHCLFHGGKNLRHTIVNCSSCTLEFRGSHMGSQCKCVLCLGKRAPQID